MGSVESRVRLLDQHKARLKLQFVRPKYCLKTIYPTLILPVNCGQKKSNPATASTR